MRHPPIELFHLSNLLQMLYDNRIVYILSSLATSCSNILAWKILWTEKSGRLQSMGLQELDLTKRLHFHFHLCSWKRISFDDLLNWSLSTSDRLVLYSSSSRPLFSLQNFLDFHCTVCSLAVPGPNALLMLQVVSAALWPILNSNKKVAWICFLSNIISLV